MDERDRPDDRVELTIVIPVLNGAATIADQLDAVIAQRWSGTWRVLVVDNASTDATGRIVEEFRGRNPHLIERASATAEHNLAYVRNEAVALARSTSVAFCDADDVVGDGWVAAIGDALRHHELVGSSLEYRRLNDVSGAIPTFQTSEIETMFGLPTLSGAGFGCRVEAWRRIGGNDPTWNATGEDFEFSMRAARDVGIVPVLVRDAVYHYRLRGDAAGVFRQNRKWGRSHVRLFKTFGSEADRTPITVALRHNAQLVVGTRKLADRNARDRWARAAGRRLGRLEGSVQQRKLYL